MNHLFQRGHIFPSPIWGGPTLLQLPAGQPNKTKRAEAMETVYLHAIFFFHSSVSNRSRAGRGAQRAGPRTRRRSLSPKRSRAPERGNTGIALLALRASKEAVTTDQCPGTRTHRSSPGWPGSRKPSLSCLVTCLLDYIARSLTPVNHRMSPGSKNC